MRVADLAHHVYAGPGAILVHRRKIEGSTPRALRSIAAGTEFAGEEAACERAPDHQSHFLVGQHRHNLTLEVASGYRIIRLQSFEARPAMLRCDALSFHDLPRLPV